MRNYYTEVDPDTRPGWSKCWECGALVVDEQLHTEFHEYVTNIITRVKPSSRIS